MRAFSGLRWFFHSCSVAGTGTHGSSIARRNALPIRSSINKIPSSPGLGQPWPTWRRAWHESRQHRRQAFNYQSFKAAQGIFHRWAARPTFYYEVAGITTAVTVFYVANLETVPVSNRRRFRVIPYSMEQQMGQVMFQETMEEFGQKLLPSYTLEHRMVQRVLDRLIPHSGLEGEEWEVHVINDDMKNAFVIPGGKVFVFSGILKVAKGEDGLAAVLGHEIAHNVAHHAAERMSQAVPIFAAVLGLWLLGLDPGLSRMALNLAFSLPGSRKQEEEADYIGLMMMADSCFDPTAAMGLWSRMEEAEKGQVPPQFLSTHPSSHNRLEKIQQWLPKARQRLEASECGLISSYAHEFRKQLEMPYWERA